MTLTSRSSPPARFKAPELRGASLELGRITAKEVYLDGPAGCIAGETRIYLPLQGQHIAVKELFEQKKAPTVQTLMGAIQAETPFKKGVADLFQITLFSGKSCIVTDDHLFYTENGWTKAKKCTAHTRILTEASMQTGEPFFVASRWDMIVSKEYVRTDEYFDLHVPIAEHYLAEGIWHHNTGKTVGSLYKVHYMLSRYPNARFLMARKANTALAASAVVTYRNNILRGRNDIRWFGGSKSESAAFRYPNGSQLIVNGLDKPEKVLSAEFDGAYINEAPECEEEDIEFVRMRLRGRTDGPDMPYRQLIMDGNPGAPTHWLNLRMNAGRTVRLISRHQDNPRYFDLEAQDWTPEGHEYIKETLGGLTGVRYARYVLGLWASTEGAVYEGLFDRARNVVKRFTIPYEWPRYMALDFGYTHPFVCQWYAQDPDGRLYMYREIYMTRRLVETHARQIKDMSRWGSIGGDPTPQAIFADHDAEGRAVFEKYTGMYTTAAHKAVTEGIQAVSSRLRVAGDNRPRVYFFEDALVERDIELIDKKLPTCTIEEFDSYVWDLTGEGRRGDKPVKEYDHGMDTLRYCVSGIDLKNYTVTHFPSIYK